MLLPVPSENPEAVPLCNIAVHEKLSGVVVTVLLRARLVAVPEHMVCEGGVEVTSGSGLTVISTLMALPEQLAAVGVMVYRTTAGEFVGLLSTWAMLFPVPSVKPVAVPLSNDAVHAKVSGVV
jgi:hypothetical protein